MSTLSGISSLQQIPQAAQGGDTSSQLHKLAQQIRNVQKQLANVQKSSGSAQDKQIESQTLQAELTMLQSQMTQLQSQQLMAATASPADTGPSAEQATAASDATQSLRLAETSSSRASTDGRHHRLDVKV